MDFSVCLQFVCALVLVSHLANGHQENIYKINKRSGNFAIKRVKTALNPKFTEQNPCRVKKCEGGQCILYGKDEVCLCPSGFYYKDDACHRNYKCRGGDYSEENGCVCWPGYGKISQTDCEECNCGKESTGCRFISNSFTLGVTKICHCNAGYEMRKSKCVELCEKDTCKNGGSCTVTGDSSYECDCSAQYTGRNCQYRNKCVPSLCHGGSCEEQKNGESICVCPKGFHLVDIGCRETVCEKKHCYGGKCRVIDGEEICHCLEGYFLNGDVCERA